ncbi:hypothetical protein [Rhodopila sp.]|uniref:hypothetical protein n=1 Tax=Rhodopila sp. TaxID=2480087 RepID=UPI003D0989FF
MIGRRDLGLSLGTMAVASPAIAPRSRAGTLPESTFDRIGRTRVVRVGTVARQAPYCVRDLTSFDWRGFIPAYGRDLAKALNADAGFVEST